MRLSFHGADHGVTGSCHLVECGGARILIDCGFFQGSREMDAENAAAFAFDPAAIDVVLLTHAHLDHCGRLPLLWKRGFRGEVIATGATGELARLVLLDTARLAEEDFERRQRHRHRTGMDNDSQPLFTLVDTASALDTFGRKATYDQPIAVAPGSAPPSSTPATSSARRASSWSSAKPASGAACRHLRATSATPAGRCCSRRRRRRRATRW